MNSTEEQIKLLESRKKALEEDIIEIDKEIKTTKEKIKNIYEFDGNNNFNKKIDSLFNVMLLPIINIEKMIDLIEKINDDPYDHVFISTTPLSLVGDDWTDYEEEQNFYSNLQIQILMAFGNFIFRITKIILIISISIIGLFFSFILPIPLQPIIRYISIAISSYLTIIPSLKIIKYIRKLINALSREKYAKPLKKYIERLNNKKQIFNKKLKSINEDLENLTFVKVLEEATLPIIDKENSLIIEEPQIEKPKDNLDNSFSLYSLSLKIELLIKKTPKEKRRDYMVRLKKIMQEHKELLNKSNLDEGTKFMGEQSILSKLINLEVDVEMNQDKKLERESNYNSINYLLDNIILEDNFIKNLEMVNSIIKEIEDKKESLSIAEQREIDNKIANIYVDIISLAMNNHDFNKELIKKIKYEYVIFITNIIEEKGNLLESNIELQQDIAKLKQYKECNYYDYITNMLYLLNSDKDINKRVLAIN